MGTKIKKKRKSFLQKSKFKGEQKKNNFGCNIKKASSAVLVCMCYVTCVCVFACGTSK